MIISEEGGLYLADMQAGSNEDLLRLMRRKSIREHFLPPEEPYYRKASVALDAYGLGRTIQYPSCDVGTRTRLWGEGKRQSFKN